MSLTRMASQARSRRARGFRGAPGEIRRVWDGPERLHGVTPGDPEPDIYHSGSKGAGKKSNGKNG